MPDITDSQIAGAEVERPLHPEPAPNSCDATDGDTSQEAPLHRRPARPARRVSYPPYEKLVDEPVPGTIGIVVYLRRSKFHGDVADAIERQLARIREEYPPDRYTIVAIYRDNDPASGDGSSKRKGYLQLVADLEGGELAGLKIAVWKRDRIDRRGWAQMKFVGDAVAKAGGVLSVMDDAHREIDATSPTGKIMTALTAALAEIESDTTKVRVNDKKRTTAEAGLNHGGQVPFGWRVTGEPFTTHEGFVGTRLAPHPVEHPALRVAVDMVLAGHSLNDVARAWAGDRGIVSANGMPLKPANISRMLHSPRLMGYRMRCVPEWERGQKLDLMQYVARHKRDVTDICSCYACWREGPRVAPGERIHRMDDPIAAAEPVCDAATWLRLQQELAARGGAARRAAWGTNEWLLSGLVSCGLCGGPLYGFQKMSGAKKTFGYRCQANRHVGPGTCAGVTVAGPPLERYVLGQMMRSLTEERLQRLTAEAKLALVVPDEDPRRDRVEVKRLELDLLETRRKDGAYEGPRRFARYLDQKERLEDEIDELQQQIEQDRAPVPRVPASTRQELVERLANGTIDQKRRLLSAAILAVVVRPAVRTPGVRQTFRTDRIEVELR